MNFIRPRTGIEETMMKNVLMFLLRLEGLKQKYRNGWNMEFAPGHKYTTRKVGRPESVSDHTHILLMMVWYFAEALGLNAFRAVRIAAVHDTAERLTEDIVTATITDPEEKRRVEAEKRVLEEAAMQEIFGSLGTWGAECIELWREYADQSSPEARMVRQLDKLEACLQAVVYRDQGEQVSPEEFFDYAQTYLTHPTFIELMKELRMYAAGSPT